MKIVSSAERIIFYLAVFFVVFFPVLWSVGFALKLYGNLPWPGVSLYAHLASFFLIIIFIKKRFLVLGYSLYYYFFIAFISYLWGLSLISLAVSDRDYIWPAFIQNSIFLYYFVFYVFVGFYFNYIYFNRFYAFFYILIFSILSLIYLNPSQTIPLSLYSIYGGYNDVVVNYQIVSFSFVFLSFFIFNGFLRLSEFVLLVLILSFSFLTGGRSEFMGLSVSLAFLATIVIFSSLSKRLSIAKKYIIGGWIVFIFIMCLIVIFFSIPELQNNRNFQVFYLNQAGSWVSREEIRNINIMNIYENPVFGNFGSHFEIGDGSYIHNFLSAWQQAGIISFSLYIVLIYFPVFYFLINYFKFENENVLKPLLVSIYIAILVAVTKSIFWPVAGLTVGMYLGYRYSNKITKEISV